MKLSDTQLVILSAACQRDDRSILPLPANLKGGAQQKVVTSLLTKELAAEAPAGANVPVWRTDADGRKLTLRATNAAFHALGIEVEPNHANQAEPAPAPKPRQGRKPKAAGDSQTTGLETEAGPSRQPRTNTKKAQLIAMLQQPDGASLDEIIAATGWQAHTVRGAIAGALKKKLGLTVTSEKAEDRGRVYRVVGGPT